MKLVNTGVIAATLLYLVVFTSCGGSSSNSNTQPATSANGSSANSSSSKTNVEELGMLINVPYESDEAFWKEDAAQKKLIAVLRFPPAEANRLIADAEKTRPPQRVSLTPESWFPAELVAQSDMSGDALNGQSYAANAFLQPPYNDGRITRIEDSDYFVLEVFAK